MRFGAATASLRCAELSHQTGPVLDKGKLPLRYDFLGDAFGRLVILGNLVAAFDTATEEQLDNAVFSKCPGAEDPSNDPPPF